MGALHHKAMESKLGEDAELSPVLERILKQQDSCDGAGYSTPLTEIKTGHKSSHWIWWIWPTLKQLRPGTMRPEFLLPDFETVLNYLQHPTLCARLCEITSASVHHLEAGINATKLFGSSTDVEKFQECLTCFIVAAKELKSLELFELFAHALELLPEPWKGLHPRAMQVIIRNFGKLKNVRSDVSLETLRDFNN